MAPRDELFEMIFKCWTGDSYDRSEPITRSMRGRINRAVVELRSVGATADDVQNRWRVAATRWPKITITPQTICSHWATLLPESRPSTMDAWLTRNR